MAEEQLESISRHQRAARKLDRQFRRGDFEGDDKDCPTQYMKRIDGIQKSRDRFSNRLEDIAKRKLDPTDLSVLLRLGRNPSEIWTRVESDFEITAGAVTAPADVTNLTIQERLSQSYRALKDALWDILAPSKPDPEDYI
jgi:hypothetical protein